jgi:phage recombination protein Bet
MHVVKEKQDELSLSNLSEQKLEVLRQVICPQASDIYISYFLGVCARLELDPFAKQAYLIPRGKQGPTVQISIGGYRCIAHRSGLFKGRLGPFWCGRDGGWKDVWLEDEPPFAARVGIKIKDIDEVFWEVARWQEYGAPSRNPLWRSMPSVMLAKTAETKAIRAAFSETALSGTLSDVEMDQAEEDERWRHEKRVSNAMQSIKPINRIDEVVKADLPVMLSRLHYQDKVGFLERFWGDRPRPGKQEFAEWLKHLDGETLSAMKMWCVIKIGKRGINE